ncbi:Protein lifeguard 2, partial [Blattella germanica]
CDITGWGAYLGVALLAFCLFSLIAFIIQLFIQSKILHLVIAGIGTAIFSLFLMYDTQQIMGGKRVEISPEEYVYGAMTLYLDVIQIFCYMLQIFAVCRGG